MEVVNNRQEGYIKITHHQSDLKGEIPNQITVKRRKKGVQTYTVIAELPITSKADLDFEIADYYVRPGTTYEYLLTQVLPSGIDGLGATGSATADFQGILLKDSTGAFVCNFSPEYTYERNISQTYASTFFSRTPHSVRMGNANYATGTAKGIFLPAGEDCMPDWDKNTAEGREQVIEFLTNGKTKLLKTYDGMMWMVQVDDKPKEERSEMGYISEFSFNWTEIDDLPVKSGVVVL